MGEKKILDKQTHTIITVIYNTWLKDFTQNIKTKVKRKSKNLLGESMVKIVILVKIRAY